MHPAAHATAPESASTCLISVSSTLADMKADGNRVTLLGNIPPRDVLAAGTPSEIERSVKDMLQALTDHSRLIVSCGGGMPPEVPTENIQALVAAVEQFR
jgi:uroporphyrinogen decarboxylase